MRVRRTIEHRAAQRPFPQRDRLQRRTQGQPSLRGFRRTATDFN